MKQTMANWQDIRALEERIYDAVLEYLGNADAYQNAVLHVYLNQDDMLHTLQLLLFANKNARL